MKSRSVWGAFGVAVLAVSGLVAGGAVSNPGPKRGRRRGSFFPSMRRGTRPAKKVAWSEVMARTLSR